LHLAMLATVSSQFCFSNLVPCGTTKELNPIKFCSYMIATTFGAGTPGPHCWVETPEHHRGYMRKDGSIAERVLFIFSGNMCFHIRWQTCDMNELPDTDTPPYVTCMSLSKTIGDWWIPDVISTMLPKHWWWTMSANCKSNRHKRHITHMILFDSLLLLFIII
jgi:hypothetical protein